MCKVFRRKFRRCEFLDGILWTKIRGQRNGDEVLRTKICRWRFETNLVRISGLCRADRCDFLALWCGPVADVCFRLLRLVGCCAILCSLGWTSDGWNSDNQLSNAISAQILYIELQDQHQPIHMVHVNGFKHNCEVLWVKLEQILQLKVGCPNFGLVRDSAIYPAYNLQTYHLKPTPTTYKHTIYWSLSVSVMPARPIPWTAWLNFEQGWNLVIQLPNQSGGGNCGQIFYF